jgi:hypothetical protein
MSDPGWPVNGADDVRAGGLPQFPVTFDPKIRLNFAAFCQTSLPVGISRNARRCRAGTRYERSRFRPANPVKIRCFIATQ